MDSVNGEKSGQSESKNSNDENSQNSYNEKNKYDQNGRFLVPTKYKTIRVDILGNPQTGMKIVFLVFSFLLSRCILPRQFIHLR